MADKTIRFEAELTLAQTEESCEDQASFGMELDMVQFSTLIVENVVLPVNKAEFVDKSSTPSKILNKLKFVKIGNNKPDDIKKEMKQAGLTFICDSEIFVGKTLTPILAFGKHG